MTVLYLFVQCQPATAYVAYDVDILVETDGGQALLNLARLSNSFEPGGCSLGDEQYTITASRIVTLSHLLAECDAEISLTARVWTR